MVPCLALRLANLLNDVSHSLEVAAVAIGSPVDDVELCDLLGLPRLGGGRCGLSTKKIAVKLCDGIYNNLAPNSCTIQQTPNNCTCCV